MGGRTTWKCMIVQIRPRVSLGLPSAMSSFRMFTNFTSGSKRTLGHTPRASRRRGRGLRPGRGASPGGDGGSPGQICTFCSLWKRILPLLPRLQGEHAGQPVSTPELLAASTTTPGSPTTAGR